MKKTIVLFILMLTLFSMCSCVGTKLTRPKDTNLEFWITENVDNVDFSSFTEKYGWFGAREYYGSKYVPTVDEYNEQVDPEYYVKYLVTNYPDYSSKHKAITQIVITDPDITFYGLSLSSKTEEIISTMEDLNFKVEVLEGQIKATMKNVTFNFTNKIIISANVSNIFRIIY